VCPQPTEFYETWYIYHNTEGAYTSSFIFQNSQQYPNNDRMKFWLQSDTSAEHYIQSWNTARKYIFRKHKISYSTLL